MESAENWVAPHAALDFLVLRGACEGAAQMWGLKKIHLLALLGLLIVAVENVASMVRTYSRTYVEIPTVSQWIIVFVGIGVWSFLFWKLLDRPRHWSVGIGVWMLLMNAFQIWLWTEALSRPNRALLGAHVNPVIFGFDELPIFLTAICCFILRASYSAATLE